MLFSIITLSFAPQSFSDETTCSLKQSQEYNKLGENYRDGKGVTQDYSKAAEYLTKAADKGNTNSQAVLGMLYADGKGVSQNYTKATEYLTKAANKGDAESQFNLGNLYAYGKGVTLDMEKAKSYFKQACSNQFQQACESYKRLDHFIKK